MIGFALKTSRAPFQTMFLMAPDSLPARGIEKVDSDSLDFWASLLSAPGATDCGLVKIFWTSENWNLSRIGILIPTKKLDNKTRIISPIKNLFLSITKRAFLFRNKYKIIKTKTEKNTETMPDLAPEYKREIYNKINSKE